ncbi:HD domain-containing phosphohydrolase [Motiliproteus sp. SC1-56]|uniref:HD domain-containing phosphohydrolase n=1 Tax=Motiliproteus sp. SC1-56 TaxID=2799565 RepID=UPI001A8C30AA|nr:HD domain-containing phosphohydrolase [Motiliproteus sp. SC1-56]
MKSPSDSVSQLTRRLQTLHGTLQRMQPDLARVAVALYDPDSNALRTYAYSTQAHNPLTHYAVPLKAVPSLQALAASGESRVIDDLSRLEGGGEHTQALLAAGLRSSFTLPIHRGNELLGFIFFNSTRTAAFPKHLRPSLEIAAYAVSLLVINEQAEVRTLQASLKTALEVAHHRNPETGEHLQRMTRYTRLIATALAEDLGLSDEYIEHLVLFSALHDIGKISIPDAILLKPSRLTVEEFEIMKSHTWRGRTLVDALIKNHALESLDYIEILGNIVDGHHECWDGSGYPAGLAGEAIPLEARIVAVGDVFDALTNERAYKDRLSNEEAFAIIDRMRGVKLDPACVDAFCAHRAEVEQIQAELSADSTPDLAAG